MILIIQENRGEINREYYGGTASVCLTARICLMETLHKARLTALHAICLQIFRHIAQKSLAIRQYACGISGQSAEKSDNAPYAQALCGVALKEKTPTKNRLLLSAKTGHFHYPNATSSVIIRANPTAKKIVPTLE